MRVFQSWTWYWRNFYKAGKRFCIRFPFATRIWWYLLSYLNSLYLQIVSLFCYKWFSFKDKTKTKKKLTKLRTHNLKTTIFNAKVKTWHLKSFSSHSIFFFLHLWQIIINTTACLVFRPKPTHQVTTNIYNFMIMRQVG